MVRVPGRGELQVQESRAKGPDLRGGTTSDRTRTLCSPHHDKGRKQRLCREGDVCDLQEGTTIREEDQCSGLQGRKGLQGQHGGGLRGVPEVSRVAASAEGLDEGLEEIPPKTIRKIKAAVQKAVGFWKQIQLILGGFQEETEAPHLQKLMKDLNSEICQELSLHPGGAKRSREIAEVMGLSHQQLKTIAEIYNPGCFGKLANRFNLVSGRVFDITLGSDLRDKKVQSEVKQYIKHVRPGLVLLAPPCRMYSQLQNLMKNKRETDAKMMQRYLENRAEAQEMLEFAIEVCQLCLSLGLKFVFEHPFAASSWRQSAMERLLADDRVLFSRADQCQYGLRGATGELHRKATGFATNDENIHKVLQRRCDGRREHEHIVGGNRSKKSQEYPPDLIKCILRSYRETVKESTEILTVEQVLEENYNLDENIKTEWRLCQEQDGRAKEPALPGGELHEGEDQGQGQRYGDAQGDDGQGPGVQEIMVGEEGEEPEGEVVAEQERLHNLPLESRFSLKRLLQRAHEGLGHPSQDKFIRILRYSKAKPEVIAEAKNLSCSVCRRHQQVRPVRRSAPLRELEFNDCVGTDVVYLPMYNQKSRPALNIIDWSTKFQLVIPLKAKKPSMVREAYIDTGCDYLDHQRESQRTWVESLRQTS